MDVLEQIRARFGAPVVVTSGRRCEAHNHKCGGVTSSQHLQGTAADIHIEGVTPQQIADYAETDAGRRRDCHFTVCRFQGQAK
ncbi:TPA: hypothetical protein N2G22_002425 [Salmonella enterica]|nr:hypothetical protein [Salmonella enterica]